jgi:hypothetical protein
LAIFRISVSTTTLTSFAVLSGTGLRFTFGLLYATGPNAAGIKSDYRIR